MVILRAIKSILSNRHPYLDDQNVVWSKNGRPVGVIHQPTTATPPDTFPPNPAVPEISKQQYALHKAKTVVEPGVLTEHLSNPFKN